MEIWRKSTTAGHAVAVELEMRPLVARCHRGPGALHRRTEKPHEAVEHLTVASTMFRDMHMPFWLGKTKRKSGR